MGRPRAGQPAVAQVFAVVDSNEPEIVVDRLQPIADIAPLFDQTAQILPYAEHHECPAGAPTTARATRLPGPG